MRILLVHNYYQRPGGEDIVFRNEARLLRQNGHDVVEYTDHNQRIDEMNRMLVATATLWSCSTRSRLRKLLHDTRCDVVHFHNTFPLISPSAYGACWEAGVPVVQTLHNYRLLCPAATFFRSGQVCEACRDTALPWPGVFHGCYRASHAQSAVVVAMLVLHRWMKTWQKGVTRYITLTEFARQKFIASGFPTEKIVVKPNFVHPNFSVGDRPDTYALFVGRLAPEKGVRTFLRAWDGLSGIPLKIAGDGPLAQEVQAFIHTRKLTDVEMLGQCSPEQVLTLMRGARFLVFPSEWYETFGCVAVEAFASGVPVIASRLGAMAEIVQEGYTGLLFAPGDPDDLRRKVLWTDAHPDALNGMRANVRQVYEDKYTPEKNYQMLLDIYLSAMRERQRRST